jgi:hypothetical protein
MSDTKSERLMRTIQQLETGKVNIFGIQGYKCVKFGLPPKNPIYTVPKDRCKNFLEGVQKLGKALPGPPSYQKAPMWPDKNKSVKMKLTSNRTTFTDEIIKITKELPAPNHYKPIKPMPKTLLGKSK